MCFPKNPAHGLESVLPETGNMEQVLSTLGVAFPCINMIGSEASVATARPVGICLARRALDLCVTNNQEIISVYTNIATYCSPSERAWEWRILLIVLSLPALQVSDDLIGLTCS